MSMGCKYLYIVVTGKEVPLTSCYHKEDALKALTSHEASGREGLRLYRVLRSQFSKGIVWDMPTLRQVANVEPVPLQIRIKFSGRKLGASGIFEKFQESLEVFSLHEAIEKLSSQYQDIRLLQANYGKAKKK